MIVPPNRSRVRARVRVLSRLIPVALSLPATCPGAGEPIRINVGGAAYTDRHGRIWLGDQGFIGGRAVATDAKRFIANTDDDPLYRTERYSTSSYSPMRYRIPLERGEYTLRLHFAETDRRRARPGQRVFDVRAEGRLILDNLDIYRDGGADRAVVRSARVNVSDGWLDLTFGRVAHNPKLNAIELIPADAPVDRSRPDAPGKPRAKDVTPSSITLVWAAARDDHEVTAYEIRRDGEIIGSINGRHTRFTDRNVGPSRRYRYEIVAHDAGGNSTASAPALIRSAGDKIPVASLTLTWNDRSDNEDGFRIERSADGRSFREVGRVRRNVTTFHDAEVEAGTRYWYRVHAYNAYGRSEYSNTVDAVCADRG